MDGPSTDSTIAMTAGVRRHVRVRGPEVRAHRLERDVERPVEGAGVRWHHGLVVLGPERDPRRPGRSLVVGVELAEQVGVGVELLARRRARGGAERARERGEVGAVVGRGEGDCAAHVRPAAEVGDVEPDDDAAGRVADQVHRRRAGLVQHRVDLVAQVPRLVPEVLGAGAGRLHDARVPPLRRQRVGEDLQRRGRAAVPGDQEHRTRPALGDRLDGRVAANDGGHHHGGHDDQHRRDCAEDQPPPGRRQRAQHPDRHGSSVRTGA